MIFPTQICDEVINFYEISGGKILNLTERRKSKKNKRI